MSLNKFVNIAKTKPLELDVACQDLEADILSVESLKITSRLSDNLYVGYNAAGGNNTNQEISLFPSTFHGSRTLPENTLEDGYTFSLYFRGFLYTKPGEVITIKLYGGVNSQDVMSIFQSQPLTAMIGQGYWYLRFDCICFDGNQVKTTARFITADENLKSVEFGATTLSTLDFSQVNTLNATLKFTNADLLNQVVSQEQEITRTR